MAGAVHHRMTNCQVSPGSAAHRAGLADRISRMVGLWRRRASERRAFESFDHRELSELHLSRWAVQQELAKPFWRG